MLKLAALDEDDLNIVSAHVQDATVRVGDIHWERSARRVILEINRFAWEKPAKSLFKTRYERRRAVLHFDMVTAVQVNGVRPTDPDEVLVLLSVHFVPGEEAPGGSVELIFAADRTLRLEVDCIEARLTDLGAAWEAGSKPAHFG